jgi:hydrogenase expression/formation protein HypC
MCLGIPGKVVEIRDDGPLRMAMVDFGGARKEACLAYVPDVALGDYVIVHVGFAISRLDEEEALRTLELLQLIDAQELAMELGQVAAEPSTDSAPSTTVAPTPTPAPGAP